MTAVTLPLRFQVGARTLAAIPRRLLRVAYSLADVLADKAPTLPPLGDADGYLVTSLPEDRLAALSRPGLLRFVRQRYVRHHTDLTAGHEAWRAALSAATRSGLKRKAKKLAGGGTLDVRAYSTPDEIAAFHPLARAVSATTYQEKLLGSGLPADPASVRHLLTAAAADRVRAWLLFLEGRPVAYLCCTAEGSALRYDHVGHDPAFAALSPGTVLQVEAMRALFEDRFARFDFTEGEGQHKRQFATGGVACVDVLLLRATLVNRVTVAALRGFDGAMALAKRGARHPTLRRLAKRARR